MTVQLRSETLVLARELSKSYNSRRSGECEVLAGASLELAAGELVVLVGPSGSGKSTLLYCLSGLEPIDSGHLELAGQDISRAKPASRAAIRRRVAGFVFQEFNLIDSLTVADNVALATRATGRGASQVLPTLERVGMLEKRDCYPSELSGGQQQRVAIARVLAAAPPIVFADEPTGALDQANSQVVVQALHELAATGSAVLIVSHDLAIAQGADRVIRLAGGITSSGAAWEDAELDQAVGVRGSLV